MPPDTLPPSDVPAYARTFDRAAIAILGTMLTLIVMLTALLVSVSAPDTGAPAPTAQTSPPPHRA